MAHASFTHNLAFLKRVPLFYGLEESALERLATTSTRRSFSKGKVVVKEGEQSQGMYVMLSGRAKVQRADDEGKEVILAVLGPGEFFGEMSLIDEEPRSATVVTLDPCEFIAITKEAFQFLIAQNNEVCLRIMRSLVQRLREADRRIETLALLDVYGRVAQVLLEFAETDAGTYVVKDRIARQDIAKMVGASREMVSRVMKALETEGYIESMPEGRLRLHERLRLLASS